MVAEVAECYDKHSEALLRFAASQVGWSDAEDVVSAAVLGVLQRRGRDVAHLRLYLYRAVANASVKHWRTASRRERRERAFVLPVPAGGVTPSGEDTSEVQVALLSALADLSVQQRAVIHLTYWEDLTPGAVAERLGVSDGSVRRQLARARSKLRTVLDEEGVR